MRTEARQAFSGIFVALLAIFLIFGSVLLSLVETGAPLALASSATSTVNLEEIPTLPYKLLPGELTLTALAGLPAASPTPTPGELSTCDVPQDWIAVTIQMEDTLESLAQVYGTTAESLRQENCLPDTVTVPAGSQIFVPPLLATFTPTRVLPPTSTAVPCGPPYGWVIYYVRFGDTLFALSLVLHVGVPDLQRANCMGISIDIYAGQPLYVPFIPVLPTATWPYMTPTPTWPPYPTPTDTPTQPPYPPPASPTPTSTNTSLPDTGTPTATNTSTVTPPPTPTATPQPPEPPTDTPTLPPTATQTSAPAVPAESTQPAGTPTGGNPD
jgi:LysM repeat protein